jgi:hypothetical protein
MSVQMPSPVDLPMPPGDPEALADLVQDAAGAAYWLTVLGERLSGPAAAAPGWIGADAAAAVTQIGRVAALTRDAGNAVLEATGRLSAHGACLREARRGVTRLREEQDEDFRAAWRQLGRIENPQLAVMTGSPAWVGVVEDVEAAEASRRRRHAAILEEVADDAAVTARVLAEACGIVGGTGARGDAGRVVAYLAAELPGWGDLEMARRGREAVGALTAGTPEELEAAARAALAYAGSAPFADALLAGLGVDGVRWLLNSIGMDSFEGSDVMPRLLATALSSATGAGPVAAVLGATYARTGDDGEHDTGVAVAGMAAVLAASRSIPSGGLPTSMVGSWARQLLLWEAEQGMPAGQIPPGWALELHDPAAIALGILAQRADPAAAAELFGDARIWQTTLARTWPDDGLALREIIGQAGQEPGTAGARAVRFGLAVVGAGLVEGDPTDWTVNRITVATVSPALALGVAAHVAVIARPLAAVADGELGDYGRDVLRGLGTVTVDRAGAARIQAALYSWTVAQPPVDAGVPPVAITVPTAYRVAQEYGQRLENALDADEKREAAENAQWFWDHTTGLVVSFVPGPVLGPGLTMAAKYAAILLHADGTWENSPDHGLVFTRDDAVDAALVSMSGDDGMYSVSEMLRVEHQAQDAFDGALRVVGHPEAPGSRDVDWIAPARDVVVDLGRGGIDRLVDKVGDAGRVAGTLD